MSEEMTLSNERLDEMLAGLESVTPGPRNVYTDTLSKAIYVTDDAGNTMAWFSPMEDDGRADQANADQFARCDPDTIRSLITELQSLRASSGVEVKPAFWAVHSATGMHIGLWDKEEVAKGVLQEYPNGKITSLHASPLPTVEVTATHRHKKRGTEYVLIGIGKMQADHWRDAPPSGLSASHGRPVDMREVAIYRSVTDPTEMWVRPLEEFEDGRFEVLSQNKGEE